MIAAAPPHRDTIPPQVVKQAVEKAQKGNNSPKCLPILFTFLKSREVMAKRKSPVTVAAQGFSVGRSGGT